MLVDYRPRVADGELALKLAAGGAVLIEGPRACGKTETASKAAYSEVRLDVDHAARAAGLVDPATLLEGERPRLIDEWQLVPEVWNHVRRAVDDAGGAAGSFILAGSAVPPDDATRHSGAGRFLRLRMRPMSLSEAGYGTGDVSLAAVLAGAGARAGRAKFALREVAELVSVGGWPGLQNRTTDQAVEAMRGYVEDTIRLDLPRLDGVQRDPERVRRLLASLARYTACPVRNGALAADVGGEEDPIKRQTVGEYIDALSRVFVVENLAAWDPALRSASRLRQTAKRHFVDPSIAVAALGTHPSHLERQVDTLGLLFESLVVRDLRIYAQALDARVFHYHDNTGLEADAVVETRDGRWAAFEVKLGRRDIDKAAAALLKLRDRIDTARHGEPTLLGVVTADAYGLRRPDGVWEIPVGALAP
jgi:predicted AAA+ superfamily ATPase